MDKIKTIEISGYTFEVVRCEFRLKNVGSRMRSRGRIVRGWEASSNGVVFHQDTSMKNLVREIEALLKAGIKP